MPTLLLSDLEVVLQLAGDPDPAEGLEKARQLVALSIDGNELQVRPSFPAPIDILRSWKVKADLRLDRQTEPLNSFFRVSLGPIDLDKANSLVTRLPEVGAERAALAGWVALGNGAGGGLVPPPGTIVPTPPLDTHQGYLADRHTGGIGARSAWALGGGNGTGVTLCDCEGGFRPQHEDLPVPRVVSDNGGNLGFDGNHGTKTLGVLAALANGIGVTGVAHGATLLFASEAPVPFTGKVFRTEAINDAMLQLTDGDVLVLEMQILAPLPISGAQVNHPAEYAIDVHAACVTASGCGITVVAAAGNSDQNLSGLLDGAKRPVWAGAPSTLGPNLDSLAILVGAGNSGTGIGPAQAKEGRSNFGQRVICQGWGEMVATTAHSNGLFNGGQPHRCYTLDFGGTSAATAMIGGLVACLQGRAKAKLGRPLDPRTIRNLLGTPANGLPQPAGDAALHPIGPLPDLMALFATASLL